MKPPVILGDGITGLASLPAGSIGMVLSDLPSGETKAEFDVRPDLDRLWSATWHALASGGACVFMAHSLSFAIDLVTSQRDRFKYELVWHKSVATGYYNAKIRPLRAHEYVLVFSREQELYQPQMISCGSPIHAARRKAGAGGENYGKDKADTLSRAGAEDRYPTSVLEFASVGTTSPERVHPQQKPVPLLSWLIRTYSVEGTWVADPFAGSGSAGVAALSCGRRFVGWDSSPRFGTALSDLLEAERSSKEDLTRPPSSVENI